MTLTQGTKVRITCPNNVNVFVFYNRDHDLYLTMTRIFSHFIVFQHIVSVFMASTVLFYSHSSCHSEPKKNSYGLIWKAMTNNLFCQLFYGIYCRWELNLPDRTIKCERNLKFNIRCSQQSPLIWTCSDPVKPCLAQWWKSNSGVPLFISLSPFPWYCNTISTVQPSLRWLKQIWANRVKCSLQECSTWPSRAYQVRTRGGVREEV